MIRFFGVIQARPKSFFSCSVRSSQLSVELNWSVLSCSELFSIDKGAACHGQKSHCSKAIDGNVFCSPGRLRGLVHERLTLLGSARKFREALSASALAPALLVRALGVLVDNTAASFSAASARLGTVVDGTSFFFLRLFRFFSWFHRTRSKLAVILGVSSNHAAVWARLQFFSATLWFWTSFKLAVILGVSSN